MDLDPAELIGAFLTDAEITHRRIDEHSFALSLRGEHRHAIAITLRLHDTHLQLESFFMRAPQDNRDAFFEMCLHRNARAPGIGFALDNDGDVFLVGRLARAAIDARALDALLGAVLIESDGMFQRAIETGFATYLEADMAWRARSDAEGS